MTRGFHMEVSEAAKVVDVYSALAANTAVSQQELAIAMSKTASSMESVGSTFEETSAMISTMVAVTRESATNIGSAMKSIASRYGELTKDPKALYDSEGDEMSFNKVDEALKSVGISLQTADHQFRDFTDVILELADAWSTLDSAQQRYIATQFAGNRQQSRFLALVSNADLIRENINVAEASEDTGTLQALKALDSLESKLNQVQVAYQQFYTTVGIESVWKTALDGIRNFIDNLNSLPKMFDKIPLGAVTVIADTVSLIRNAGLSALSTIAKPIAEVLNDQLENVKQKTGEKAHEVGDNIAQQINDGIQQSNKGTNNSFFDIRIDEAKQKVKELAEVVNSDVIELYDSLNWQDLGAAVPTEILTDFRAEFDPLIEKLITTGAISQRTADELRTLVPSEVLSKLRELQGEAQNSVSKLTGLKDFVNKYANNASGFAMALNVIANVLDKSSAAGRIFAGVLMTIGGAIKGISEVSKWMATGGTTAFPWLAVATAAITVVNGLSTAIETDQEKLERLTEEAEKLNNEAKKAKADYNTIQRTADKIDELKEKRYESIEAEQEYRAAVEELAEKVPNLIVGLDDAGNVIVETSNLEYELEKARKAAAQATLDAAKAERVKAQEELNQAKNRVQTNLEVLTEENSLKNLSIPVNGGLNGENFNIGSLIKEGKVNIDDWRDFVSDNALSDWTESSLLNKLTNRGVQGLVFDKEAEKTFINDIDAFKDSIEAIEEFSENGPLHQIAIALVEAQKNGGSYSAITQTSSRIKALAKLTGEEFNNELENIVEFIGSNTLNDIFEPFLNAVQDYNNGIIKIDDLKNVLTSTRNIEISDIIKNLTSTEEEFIKSVGEGQVLFSNWLTAQTEGMTDEEYEKYIASGGEMEKQYQDLKNSLSHEEWDKFGELWKNREQYTVHDWELLFKEAGPDFIDAISEYYFKQGMDYTQQFADKVTKLDADLPIDLSNLNSLLANSQDIISKSFSQWLYNGLDTLQKYFEGGNFHIAEELSGAMEGVIASLDAVDNPELTSAVSNILKNTAWTEEGINEAIAQIENLEGSEGIVTALSTVKDLLLTNIPLTIQMAIEQVGKDAEESVDAITKAYKGFTKLSDARAFLQTINDSLKEGQEKYTLNDLNWDGKNFSPTKELIDKYIEIQRKNITDAADNVNTLIENKVLGLSEVQSADVYTNAAKYADKTGFIPIGKEWLSTKDDEILFNALKTSGLIDVDEENGIFTLSETLSEAIEKGGTNFNILEFVANYLKEQNIILEEYAEYYDKTSEQLKREEISTALANLKDAATKYAEGFETKINLEDYAKELGAELKEKDYSYNEELNQWFINAQGYLKIRRAAEKKLLESGGNPADAKRMWEESSKSLLANIDVNGYFSSNKTAQDEATLRQAYESWYQTLVNKTGKLTTNEFMTAIEAGGEEAVKAAERIAAERGEKLSTSELENIYRSDEFKKLLEAGEQLDSGIGDIVDSKAYEILNAAGYIGEEVGDNHYIITSLGNVEQAYEEYFNQLISDAEATEEEINKARNNLIEKHNDNRTKTSDIIGEIAKLQPGEWFNATELLKDVSDIPQKYIEQLQSFGAIIEDGILKTDARTNMAGVITTLRDTAKEMGKLTQEELAILNDTVNEVLDGYIEAIQKGIEGGLTEVEKLNLEHIADVYNVKIDFTKTAEGLKLSEKSARDLYLALRDVDSVRAKLVFDKLAESLEKTNSNYKDISTITARIVELEKEINNPKISTARREEYQKELEVAKEIQETRSLTDTGNFNFMERDLPTGMQNPQDYWQGVYQWYESMNKAGENGYMSVKDFYNGVQEANNLAKISGDSIYFMGEWLNGSAEKASALIQRGMNALANIDGVGPAVSLERFGNQFKGGAKDMAKGVDDGVKSMAKSQIKMLDAMISALELVVAMEKLDDISGADKKLDFAELFPFYSSDNNNFNLDQKGKIALQGILDASKTNLDLANALDTFRINGVSLRQEIQKAIDGNIKNKEEADLFYATLAGLQEALQTGDFNPDNIKQVIINNLQKKLTDGKWADYTLFDGTHVKITSDGIIEQNKDGTWKLEDGTNSYKTAEEAQKAYEFKKKTGFEGIFKNGNIEKEIAVTENIKIKITENAEGEIEYHVGNTIYNTKEEAIRAAAAIARGESAEGASHLTEDEIIEYDFIAKFRLTATEVANLTGKSMGELSDDMLVKLGIDVALVNSIEAAVERALKNINLGELILDGLLGEEGANNLYAVNSEELKNNPKLVELGRQLGTGIVLAIKNGITEANSGEGEDAVGGITDSVVEGLENGKGDIEEAAGHAADSAATPFKNLIDSTSDDGFKIWGMTAIEQFVDGFNIVDSNGNSNFAEILGGRFLSSIRAALTGQEMFNAGKAAADMFVQGFGGTEGAEGEQTSTVAQKITAPIRSALQDLFSKETLDQLVKHFETNSTIALSFDHIDVGKLTEAASNVESAVNTVIEVLGKLKNSLDSLPDKSSDVQSTATAMKNLPDKSSEVEATANAINNLKSKDIKVTGHVSLSASVKTNGALSVSAQAGPINASWAKGNVLLEGTALAGGNGKKTLVGELGPELVVSGGRYYVVGQNGAEMVDLDDDAIVFNHIQTKRLLSTGTAGRGKPVTNEKNAVSYATGNISGPAMASASETLALLKEIRAMWQGMLTASAKQLGSQAGISAAKNKDKGNRDSSGNDDTFDEDKITSIKNATAEIQRWYNLIRQIDKLEKDIAYQESLINKYQNDRIANGDKMYSSYKKQLQMLDVEINKNKQLAELQKSWYDNKRTELASSAYGKIFTYTEDGLQQYVDGPNRGLDILEKLNQQTIYGEGVGHAQSSRAQLAYLQSIGFNLNDLIYGSNGRVVKAAYGLDTMYNEAGELLTGQELIDAQTSLMENFWSKVDGWRDELDELYDSYREQWQKITDNQTKANEILQKIVNNQIEVENAVLEAIVSARQREIDELQENRDAYEETTSKMINGLNKALSEERRLYQTQQDRNDLTKMQRQLAILQRSGGSVSQIKSLQNQISAKQQEMYFDEREQQIQSIQDAADKQIEQLDAQIDLMTESLEYQKEHGMLWDEVYQIMSKEESEILDFITANGADWEAKSSLQKAEDIRVLLEKIQLWTERRDDEEMNKLEEKIITESNDSNYEYQTNIYKPSNDTPTYAEDSTSYPVETDFSFDDNNYTPEPTYTEPTPVYTEPTPTPEPYYQPQSYSPSVARLNEGSTTTYKLRSDGKFKSSGSMGHRGDEVTVIEEYAGVNSSGKQLSLVEYKGKQYYIRNERLAYKDGGPLPVDYTGPLWFDGTASNLEYVFTSPQMDELKDIRHQWNDLLQLSEWNKEITTLRQQMQSSNGNNNTNNLGETVNIGQVAISMNVEKMSNDYEARKAAHTIMDELVSIARKSGGYNGITRR